MKCAILELQGRRRAALASRLRSLRHTVYCYAGGVWCPDLLEQGGRVEVFFIHTRDAELWNAGAVKEVRAASPEAAVVWYSGSGFKSEYRYPADGFSMRTIFRSMDDPGKIPEDEWRELLGWFERGTPPDSPVPRLLCNYEPLGLVALSVLCRGYLMAWNPRTELPNKNEVAKQVASREWWATALGQNLDAARLEAEWGLEELPTCITGLVKWINGGSAHLEKLVEEVKDEIDAHLAPKSG